MSLGFVIFVPGGRPPDGAAIAGAGQTLGFSIQIEPYDPLLQTGSLPVTIDGVDGAFEYYADQIADYLEDVGGEYSFFERTRLRIRFAWAVSLILHSRSDDLFVASRFGAAMTLAARGQLMDMRGDFLAPDQLTQFLARISAPKNVAERKGIAEHVHAALGAAITLLGYSLIEPLERGDRWYYRKGSHFTSQFITSSAYFDGDESFCAVHFYGSPLTVAELRNGEMSGNVTGMNLFDYQWGQLDRPPESVLPKNILVDAEFDTKTLPQVQRELAEVEPAIWSRLKELAEKDLS
jgi:hypothetical protein